MLNNTSRWVNYFVGGWQLAGTTTLGEPVFHPYLQACGQAQDAPNKSDGGAIEILRTGYLPKDRSELQ
jgi:hypothetical protein